MNNVEKIYDILQMAEQNHLNLYHSVDKKEVLEFIKKNENLCKQSQSKFMLVVNQIFGLFKDAHTLVHNETILTDKNFEIRNNICYFKKQNKLLPVLKLAGLDIEKVKDMFSKVCSYETAAWREYLINSCLLDGAYYKMYDLWNEDGVKFSYLEDGVEVEDKIFKYTLDNEHQKSNARFYSAKPLADDVLYVRYAKCKEHENYPFATFVQDIKNKNIQWKTVVLDVRNNSGGNSEILNPFMEYVKELNCKTYVMMNRRTFSAGRFAVCRFKKMGATLVGRDTGGAAVSYGNSKTLKVHDVSFQVSTKFFKLLDNYEQGQSIKPDIYIPVNTESEKMHDDSDLVFVKNLLGI